jgi:PIN domain nuclease of toxin-antitoxin system
VYAAVQYFDIYWILITVPFDYRDPFDRILITQVIFDRLTLLSADAAFRNYDVDCNW